MPIIQEDVGGTIVELAFTAALWAAGVANEIGIVRSGVPGVGQIGPHNLALGSSYLVQVYEDTGGNILSQVDVEVDINTVTGLVTLRKAPLAPNFAGRVILEAVN